MKVLILLAAVAIAMGCVDQANYSEFNGTLNNTVASAAVKIGDHVFVEYMGMLEDGTVFDTSLGRAPLEFDAGAGQMIAGFDNAVIGMKIGEEKTVTIQPEQGYGYPDPANVIRVIRENIPANASVGDTLYAGGQPVTIVEISEEDALVDFNHPLAGKTLVFNIKLVGIGNL